MTTTSRAVCLNRISMKYIARAGKKDATIQELKKARWYLDREIANMEKASG